MPGGFGQGAFDASPRHPTVPVLYGNDCSWPPGGCGRGVTWIRASAFNSLRNDSSRTVSAQDEAHHSSEGRRHTRGGGFCRDASHERQSVANQADASAAPAWRSLIVGTTGGCGRILRTKHHPAASDFVSGRKQPRGHEPKGLHVPQGKNRCPGYQNSHRTSKSRVAGNADGTKLHSCVI